MEPYPKSKAKELHQNEIEIERESADHVSFVPFLGISPHRYRDIFQKTAKRKRNDGQAKRWISETERPLTDNVSTYLETEIQEYGRLLTKPSSNPSPNMLTRVIERMSTKSRRPTGK
jgi:hypothetical protein